MIRILTGSSPNETQAAAEAESKVNTYIASLPERAVVVSVRTTAYAVMEPDSFPWHYVIVTIFTEEVKQ